VRHIGPCPACNRLFDDLHHNEPSVNSGFLSSSHSSVPTFVGFAPCHVGELWQGALRRGARTVSALCTLTSNRLGSCAVYEPAPNAPLFVTPETKYKALAAAHAVLDLHGDTRGGRLRVYSQLGEGKGMGSSTSESLAAARVVAAALGRPLTRDQEFALLLGVDGAVDPIAIEDRVVLVAHREGRILHDYGRPLPPMRMVVFDTDLEGVGIATASLERPTYTPSELSTHARLVEQLRCGVERGDLELIGRVSTTSAKINQRYLPKPKWDEILRVAKALQLAGVVVAHTGTVCAFLIAPDRDDCEADATRRVRELGFRIVWTGERRVGA
jgi:uncharacterized protein involved in propanediol utilization